MFLYLEISNPPSIEAMAVTIPESLGLLVFGVGLVVVALMLRSFFARAERSKAEKKAEESLVSR